MTDHLGDPADKAADGAFGGKPTASHRSGYGSTLARVEGWLRCHPDATLQSGEGRALLEEIDRLREQLRLAHIDAVNEATENDELRSELAEARGVIERVRALCGKPHQFVIVWEVLRALGDNTPGDTSVSKEIA